MSELTPMLAQYRKMKAEHKDALLLFRMGDFYEMFYEDAQKGAQVLGLTLTSRNHGKAEHVPLAGLPHHALENYLPRLVKAGYKVAICEQVEDPKKAKGLVKREVVEVVTAGTALSDVLLDSRRNNFLVSVSVNGQRAGLCITDLSTGEFQVTEVPTEGIWSELERIRPAEVLIAEEHAEDFMGEFERRLGGQGTLTQVEGWTFRYEVAYDRLREHFGVTSLKGFGCDHLKEGISAAGAALSYLQANQKRRLSHISRMSWYDMSAYMVLDPSTQRNLELTASMLSGGKEGTLLSILDRTRTPMGARLLRRWLSQPLKVVDLIEERLHAVQEMVQERSLSEALCGKLENIGDVERLITKVVCGRANGRDLVALRRSLEQLPGLRADLHEVRSLLLIRCREDMGDLNDVTVLIEQAIVDEPPVVLTEGGMIREGFNRELDELRKVGRDGRDWIARLQSEEQRRTGISSLKVGYNKVFGYYIEVTKPNIDRVPSDYIRKQTLVNAERFITPALKEYEAKVLGAEERIGELEYGLFVDVRDRVAQRAVAIQNTAAALGILDVIAAFAEVAQAEDYVRPVLDEGNTIEIEDGRHPVVEQMLAEGQFVPNDVQVDTSREQILIITGPNMSGKSTFLRQVGLIVLLAQIGGFVPARKAHIGVVDRIFTRVGASDNLAAGESTFLVEMNEAANILHNATPKSLILLDEIGRGTSTFDGLSIAWAITEFLHNVPRVRARTLFATHYHELVELERVLPRIRNYNVAVREDGQGVVFLRKIVRGGCDHSYGIHVAKLAGVPQEVIERAEEILTNLEKHDLDPMRLKQKRKRRAPAASDVQISLFESARHPVLDEILHSNPYDMTPLEALNRIVQWKNVLEKTGGSGA